MWKPISAFAAALFVLPACPASELTPTETRWLRGAWPVIAFVRNENLPLDVVAQPQASAAPLALGFVDGRCWMGAIRGRTQQFVPPFAHIGEFNQLVACRRTLAAFETQRCLLSCGLPLGFGRCRSRSLPQDPRPS